MRLLWHWVLFSVLLVPAFFFDHNLLRAIVLCYGVLLACWALWVFCRNAALRAWERIRYDARERRIRSRDANTESPLERALAAALDEKGLMYVREYQISRIHVDFAFPHAKLAVECDGWRYHDDKKDKARDAFLRSQGWRVLRLKGDRIRTDLQGCVRQIIEHL